MIFAKQFRFFGLSLIILASVQSNAQANDRNLAGDGISPGQPLRLPPDASATQEILNRINNAQKKMHLPAAKNKPNPVVSNEGSKLIGGVSHSVSLQPLPQIQRPGRIFRGDAVTAGGTQRGKKFQVPDWMAGIWQRSQAKELSRVELPSGKKLSPVGTQIAQVKDVFGTYRDESGKVWQVFDPLKATGQVDRGQSMDYHRVHAYDLVITGPKTAVVEVQATHTMVSKANRKIANVYQDEELNKYTLLPSGRLQTDSSVKVFDMNGKAFLLTRSVSSEFRLPPNNWPPRAQSQLTPN